MDKDAASEVPASVRAEWAAAAERVFAPGLNNPGAYQQATRLIGQALQILRQGGAGFGPLLDAHEGPHVLMDRVLIADRSLSSGGFDPAQVVAAACAMRYREVVEEVATNRRREVLAATDDPNEWVVLQESGARDGDPFSPYQRLEAQPATGLAIVVSTSPDEDVTGCVHSVEVLGIDADTGRFTTPPPSLPASGEFDSESEREDEVSRLKQELATRQD